MHRCTRCIIKALTLRDIPPRVARAIEERARADHSALGRAALALIAEAAGLAPEGAPRRDLSDLGGTWSAREADAFDAELRAQRAIDPELWK